MRLGRLRTTPPLLGFACLAVALNQGVHAQTPESPASESHAKVELVREEPTGRTGDRVWVGLLFHLDPGWHIYWQNPGDSGEPPKVQWELPPGWNAGAIRWPLPARLGHGPVVDYGYERRVLLMAPLERATATTSTLTSIGADVKYLVCSDICIPGKVHLMLSFPANDVAPKRAAEPASEHRSLFEKTRAQLPRTMPTAWKASATQQNDRFILSVRTGSQVRSATFFPLESGQIENSAPQLFSSNTTGFQLALRKSDQLTKSPPALKGLLVLDSVQAFDITAPMISRQ
jgi:DsbC/DsbD-like thiol-disulfide interchange protein